MKIATSLPIGVQVTVKPVATLSGTGIEALAKEALKTVGTTGGGVAITTTGWHAFQTTHTVTQDQMLSGLLQNGVTPDTASQFAAPLHSIVKSDPTRLLFIAITGGGMGITVLEATRKFDVPWKTWGQKKILLVGGICGALLLSAIYLTLKYFGIMN